MVLVVVLFVLLVIVILAARKVRSRVRIKRNFNATVATVWKLWTEEEHIKQWWGPKGYTAPVIKNDFRVGGQYLFAMRAPNGTVHYNCGEYKEIVSEKKIVTTMSFSDENGKATPGREVKMPGDWPDAILITTTFTEQGGKTTVAITEESIPLIMKLFADMGWQQQLDKFEGLLLKMRF